MVTEKSGVTRRDFLTYTAGGVLLLSPLGQSVEAAPKNKIFWVNDIPNKPFRKKAYGKNHHVGVECLVHLMGKNRLKLYRSPNKSELSGPKGMIASDDVVLIKVNAQWKYRGCTNSDLIRGLIQRILEHPDTFTGEVVLIENGQGWGSLNCDSDSWNEYGNSEVHANANNPKHTFLHLANNVFKDSRVSTYLFDLINRYIADGDHLLDGYRRYENVSYPCFTTTGGNRVELREGIWNGNGYSQNLKLINVPVLKTHAGCGITASLKHTYGILSMPQDNFGYFHYSGLGEVCGKMMVSVRTPVLNIVDAIWVSYGALKGYPPNRTYRANQIMASQDPVALDYCAAKYVLHPISNSVGHAPESPAVDAWLTSARNIINSRGGLFSRKEGILVRKVTKSEEAMKILPYSAKQFITEQYG